MSDQPNVTDHPEGPYRVYSFPVGEGLTDSLNAHHQQGEELIDGHIFVDVNTAGADVTFVGVFVNVEYVQKVREKHQREAEAAYAEALREYQEEAHRHAAEQQKPQQPEQFDPTEDWRNQGYV